MRALIVMAVAIAVLASSQAGAVVAMPCQHSPQCSARELCVADTPTSSWGTCRLLRVLP